MSKMITTKVNNKTIYRIVPDDYKEDDTDDRPIGDLTTSRRAFMSYTDVKQENWDKIFSKEKKMDRTIKLYSAQWCGSCRIAKASLEANNIKYEYIDVDTSDDPIIKELEEIPVAISYKGDKEESRWCQADGDISDWVKNFLEKY